jgi:hypothetical protein
MELKMNAKTARELAETARSLDGEHLKKETDQLLKIISNSALAGKLEVYTYNEDHMDPIIHARLKQLGFGVKFTRDPRDGASLEITW